MENYTNEQIKVAAEIYQKMGVSANDYLYCGEVINIFDFLSIKPDVDESGKRNLTPYELLGILPNINGGVENPIVFFIKHKIKNIKLVKISKNYDFTYLKDKNKDDNSLIDFVLKSYKTAIAQNNLSEAERHFDMLNKLTGGKAKHYVSGIYDYTKFYKQMKKQLLIDLFSHFFLIYLAKRKSLIKKGLIIKNKKFVPYDAKKKQQLNEEILLPEIKSIRIDEVSEDVISQSSEKSAGEEFAEIELDLKKITNESKKTEVISQSVNTEKKSFIRRIKGHLFRKNKKKLKSVVTSPYDNPNFGKSELDKEVIYE